MDETTKEAMKVLIKSLSRVPRRFLNNIFTPVISFITGTIFPFLSDTFGFISANVFPVFDQQAKSEIIFWFQIVAFVVSIISGISVYMRNRRKVKKNK